ncbi:uncharacterized protein LOC112097240 isoform X3 [Citrus clementina]|uniref:uncharacterized protein LOC112097240 isoform X3 n=1 Tax=Citrus clementina TaxID=85681 RepID=UPI000CED5AC8|nr:uncharacterized protein LOC112097240 isoform X3 [Citrus x clementina]
MIKEHALQERFAAAVGQLTDKQREVVCEMGLDNLIKLNCGRLKRKLCCWLVERTDVARCVIELNGSELQINANSFRYIMGVTDGGLPLLLEGDRSHVAAYLEKYNVTSSGINIKTLADILQNSREANEEFKVTFMLFTLCTVITAPMDQLACRNGFTYHAIIVDYITTFLYDCFRL